MASRLRSDINVTPLVGIVLLIVFITLVPAPPRVLSVALPGQGPITAVLSRLCLTLTRDSRLEVAGRSVKTWTAQLLAHRGPIMFRVHPDLLLYLPAKVLDEIQALRLGLKVTLVAWPG